MKPSDRVAAVAWNTAKSAYVLHVSGEIKKPIVLKIQGDNVNTLDALHLVIEADSRSNADIIIEHTGCAKLAEGVEIILGKHAHVSTTFIQEWIRAVNTLEISVFTLVRELRFATRWSLLAEMLCAFAWIRILAANRVI